MRWIPPVFAACLMLASISSCAAEVVQAHHARVELLSQEKAGSPNRQIMLGAHFSLEKDWHIYWINPGDSGQPPVFEWQLPSGFSAGAIEWPTPEKLKRSSLADYGYKDDVMLLVPIHVPAGLKTDSKIEIGLKAKWLICSDVCIPDHAELHLSLPISSAPAPDADSAAAFAAAAKHLPKPWPHSWTARVVSGKDDFVLIINAGNPIASAEFFPLAAEQIDNAARQILQTTPHGARITLKKSDQLLRTIAVLKGLLVMGSEAYQMEARVQQ
jgi:DsbC/DsbD-like thiol-disulfide interchange protein